MTRIIIVGSKGRMGQALLSCASRMAEVEVVGALDEGDDLTSVIDQCDGVIEFSFHTVTPGVAELCAKHGKFLVIGTTGHTEEEKSRVCRLTPQAVNLYLSKIPATPAHYGRYSVR